MRIALLHHTFPPVAGGVERVLGEHAALLAAHGHAVTVLCGEGSLDRSDASLANFTLELVPELRGSSWPSKTPSDWEAEAESLSRRLKPIFAAHDVVLLHNVLTMPFHLVLTAAIWLLADEKDTAPPSTARPRLVGWVHDIAAINTDYQFPDAGALPHALLRRAHPVIEYVAVSERRRQEWCGLCGIPDSRCLVVPNGVDPCARLQLTPAVTRLCRHWKVLDRDVVLFHPARLLSRKNIEWSLRVLAAIREESEQEQNDALLLLTASPDPHRSGSAAYARELMALCRELGIEDRVCWVPQALDREHDEPLTSAEVDSLYSLSDGLVFPSRQEGFGLPLLEAAIHRIPIFCSDIEPLRSLFSVGKNGPTLSREPLRPEYSPATAPVTTFPLEAPPRLIAREILRQIRTSAAIQGRKRVMREYAWPTIYRNYLAPLLNESEGPLTELRALPLPHETILR